MSVDWVRLSIRLKEAKAVTALIIMRDAGINRISRLDKDGKVLQSDSLDDLIERVERARQ